MRAFFSQTISKDEKTWNLLCKARILDASVVEGVESIQAKSVLGHDERPKILVFSGEDATSSRLLGRSGSWKTAAYCGPSILPTRLLH